MSLSKKFTKTVLTATAVLALNGCAAMGGAVRQSEPDMEDLDESVKVRKDIEQIGATELAAKDDQLLAELTNLRRIHDTRVAADVANAEAAVDLCRGRRSDTTIFNQSKRKDRSLFQIGAAYIGANKKEEACINTAKGRLHDNTAAEDTRLMTGQQRALQKSLARMERAQVMALRAESATSGAQLPNMLEKDCVKMWQTALRKNQQLEGVQREMCQPIIDCKMDATKCPKPATP
jgi:hypothetical protein